MTEPKQDKGWVATESRGIFYEDGFHPARFPRFAYVSERVGRAVCLNFIGFGFSVMGLWDEQSPEEYLPNHQIRRLIGYSMIGTGVAVVMTSPVPREAVETVVIAARSLVAMRPTL